MPSSPRVGSKMAPGVSEVWFPLSEENDRLLLYDDELPHRGVSCRSLFVVGTTKGLILIGSKTLRVFRGAVFEEEVFSLLHKLRLEQGGMTKGRVPEFLASRFP